MKPTVIVHGGAGDVPEAQREPRMRGCERAAEAGIATLQGGGSALDACVTAVKVLESDELFNAGRGAALTREGEVELDAAVMEGRSLRAGAVAALPPFEHPIEIARAVLEAGGHVLYAAHGAARFAWEHGFSPAAPDALVTERARRRLASALAAGEATPWAGGTVGAVAIDASGDLAAATSTGGTVAKRAGRIGDSPVLGAGTHADNALGACSVTGDGEAVLRQATASVLLQRLALRPSTPESPREVADAVLEELERRFGGRAGLIAITPKGEIVVARRTATMSHAVATRGEAIRSGC